MKFLKTSALGVLLSVCMLQVEAQQDTKKLPISQYDFNKPKLFKDLPDRINVPLKNFDNVFDFEVGKSVDLPFSSNFLFSGTVVSKAEDVASNVKSIVIKSTNKVGATLALSRMINPDNTITYRGRIMSFKHGDAYEIANENGSYYLVKKSLYDLYEE
jgi:hypothetical protein